MQFCNQSLALLQTKSELATHTHTCFKWSHWRIVIYLNDSVWRRESFDLASEGRKYLGARNSIFGKLAPSCQPHYASPLGHSRPGREEGNGHPRRDGLPAVGVPFHPQAHLGNGDPAPCALADSFFQHRCESTRRMQEGARFWRRPPGLTRCPGLLHVSQEAHLHLKWPRSSRSSKKEMSPFILGHWKFCGSSPHLIYLPEKLGRCNFYCCH